jgi:DNA-binding MarR family transcriptional regulator
MSRSGATPEPPLSDEVEFLAIKASAAGTRLARARLKPLGLSVRSYAVLAVSATPSGRTQREIAEYLDLDPSQVVGLLDELESSGLVTREVNPSDRRARLVRATAEGRALLAAARSETAAAEAEALAMLSREERDTLLRLLRKIVFDGGARED